MCSNSIIGSGNSAVSVCKVVGAPRRGPLTPPHLNRSLDTLTKIVPYNIIFKLIPTFKLLHKSEVTVAQGTLLNARVEGEEGVTDIHIHKGTLHLYIVEVNKE